MTTTLRGGRTGRVRAIMGTRRASTVVRTFGYALTFGGILTALQGSVLIGLWLVLLGWLVARLARATYNEQRLGSLLDGLRAVDALQRDPPGVAPSLMLETLVEEDARQTAGSGLYPVQLEGAVLGVIDVVDADRVPRGEWATTRVDHVMRPLSELDLVPPEEPLLEVVARLERSRREAFAVVDPADPGSLLGLVTRERVHALIRSRASRDDRARRMARR